jgi:hypothetical protein
MLNEKNILIASLILLLPSITYGQKHHLKKNKLAIERIIGSWKFEYAVYTFYRFIDSPPSKEKSDVFHTDTIHFYANMTYRFNSHDFDYKKVSAHSGEWNVINKGKTLILKNRVVKPAIKEPLVELSFPIKIKKANILRIDYSIYIKGDSINQKPNNTPVFFSRIE